MDQTISNCNFCTDYNQPATNIAELTPLFQRAIIKHFWFQESELLALQICADCSKKVMDFHMFYSTVERLHTAEDHHLEDKKYLTEQVIVKNEPLESELITGDITTNGEQLAVGDLAFEIVDVCAKTELVENDSNELPDEVKHEIAEALINKIKTVACLNCTKSFEGKKILELHMKLVHGDRTTIRKCSQCARLEQALKESLEQDIAEVPESSARVQCTVCDGKLKNVASLQKHLTWHWGEPCSMCRKRPNNYEPTEDDQEEDNDEATDNQARTKTYVCNCCEKQYILKKHLKAHMEKNHKFSPGKCQKCEALDQALQELTERTESGESGRVKCGVCDAWLVSLASFQRHLAWHKSEPCDGCGFRRYSQVQNMPKTKSEPVNSQAKRIKLGKTTTMHTCVYCGLDFDLHVKLIKHQVEEHPKQKYRKYTSTGN